MIPEESKKSIEDVIHMLGIEHIKHKTDINAILTTVIPCSKEFAENSMFFCNENPVYDQPYVTPLGIINGILYELGINRIARKFDINDGVQTTFEGFCLYDESVENEN